MTDQRGPDDVTISQVLAAARAAALAPPDAEAVAIARLAGLGAADAGAVLGVAAGEVGRRRTRGLMPVRTEAASARGRSACADGEAAPASMQPACARAQMACA